MIVTTNLSPVLYTSQPWAQLYHLFYYIREHPGTCKIHRWTIWIRRTRSILVLLRIGGQMIHIVLSSWRLYLSQIYNQRGLRQSVYWLLIAIQVMSTLHLLITQIAIVLLSLFFLYTQLTSCNLLISAVSFHLVRNTVYTSILGFISLLAKWAYLNALFFQFFGLPRMNRSH